MITSKIWSVIRDIKNIYGFKFVLFGDFFQLLCTCQSLRRSVRLVLQGGSRDGETASYPRRNRLRSSQTTTDQAGRMQPRSESVTDTVNRKQA